MSDASNKILINVVGKDSPGILASLCQTISKYKGHMLDVDQHAFHGLIHISILVQPPVEVPPVEMLLNLELTAQKLGVTLDHKHFTPMYDTRQDQQYILTLMGDRIGSTILGELAAYLSANKINVERIRQLDNRKVHAMELGVSSKKLINQADFIKGLIDFKIKSNIDVAIQKDSHFRRAKRLIVFDADMTFIQCEVIDELGRLAGVEDKVKEITHRAMNGEIDFAESLTQRVSLLKGIHVDELHQLAGQIPFTTGIGKIIKILKKLGYKIGILSGGFTFFISYFKEMFNLDYGYANTLEIENGRVTGKLINRVVDAQAKADLLEEIAQKEGCLLQQTIAVGDGANDLLMLDKAGLGISFNAKPIVQEQSQATLNTQSLDKILYFLGLTGTEIDDLEQQIINENK